MPDPFIDSPRFPDCISQGSTGGPTYRTDVNTTESGHELRNAKWSIGRHRFNAAYGVRNQKDLEDIRAWFHVTLGQAFAFRYRDWGDYKSCPIRDAVAETDQVIGQGDGALATFQLVKRYTVGAHERVRPINKPVDGTVVVAVNNAPLTPTDFSVDTTTGVVTLFTAPVLNATVTAGYEFDVPVRFEIDELDESLEAFQAGQVQCPLVEVRVR